MPEAVASMLSSGAGRMRDYAWPSPPSLCTGGAANLAVRLGGEAFVNNPIVTAVGFGGGGSTTGALVNGVAMADMPSTAVALNGVAWFAANAGFNIRTAPQLYGPDADQESAFRCIFIMAAQFGGGGGFDIGGGVCMARQSNCRPLADNENGIFIRIGGANVAQLVIRGQNGLVTQALTSAPFDTTQLHSYELRIVSAGVQAGAYAQLQVLIDAAVVPGLPAISTSWAPGTNLPANQRNGTQMGYFPTMHNTSGLANHLYGQFRGQYGPNLLNTL